MRFHDGDTFFFAVNHKQSTRQTAHLLDAAQSAFQLLSAALHAHCFLLQHACVLTVFAALLLIQLQPRDGALDCIEVGEQPAQPPFVDEKTIAAACLFRDEFPRLCLGAHEQQRFATGRQVAHVLVGFL